MSFIFLMQIGAISTGKNGQVLHISGYFFPELLAYWLTVLFLYWVYPTGYRLSSDARIFQPLVIELFRSSLLDSVTLPQNVTSAPLLAVFRKRLKTSLQSFLPPIPCSACAIISDTIMDLFLLIFLPLSGQRG